jgi:antirestriction protein ArdC
VSSQEIISRNSPKIEYGRNPSYNPILDVIRIPGRNEFDSSAEYYSTLFHELGHWTGHKTRLNREEVAQAIIFGSSDYSKEELTAELTASFLCSVSGIRNTSVIENEIAYIQSWIEVLKRDKKFIISAGSKAKKAADFLLSDLEEEPLAKSSLLVLEPPPFVEKKTIGR